VAKHVPADVNGASPYLGFLDEWKNLQPRKQFDGTFPSVKKLGLPYNFAQNDSWNVRRKCPQIQKLEFHDWGQAANKDVRVLSDPPQISPEDKAKIKIAVKGYWNIETVKKISVLFGKSDDKVVYSDRKKACSSSTIF